MFDPTTLAQKEAVIRVIANEPLTINRITYQAYRLETVLWNRPMTFWIDEDGTTLKEEGFMGLTTIKSSAANAPLNMELGMDDDFYELTSVSIDKPLPDPIRLSYLKLQIEGLDSATAPEGFVKGGDDRQRFHQGIVELYREEAPYKASYTLPKDDWDQTFRSFLEPEFNIESDSKEIKDKVREIVEDKRNPVSVARRLMIWVYDNLEKRPVISIPSALEVLRTRVGDCNEHATLLCAMLRAAGIPARINVGLVYSRNHFYYHAWTEAYMGHWLSMDATLNQMPTDVSHIRMVQGNVDQQVEIMGLIGRISFKLLDYKL
jgi:transglutaminase-like putative cysteine protease